MQDAAARLDALFAAKQANLTEAVSGVEADAGLAAWDDGRNELTAINDKIEAFLVQIKALKNSIDPAALAKLKTEAGKRNGIYVLVQGTFDASGRGHQGRSTPGSIVSVVRLDPWPPPLPLPPP